MYNSLHYARTRQKIDRFYRGTSKEEFVPQTIQIYIRRTVDFGLLKAGQNDLYLNAHAQIQIRHRTRDNCACALGYESKQARSRE